MVPALVLLIVLAVGAVLVNRIGLRNEEPAASAPLATTASEVPGVRVDLAQPFVSTPAAGWADGEAGVVAPAAVPVGGFDVAQVAAAYEQVRQVVIAARLDRAVIEGHDVERYLALFAPEVRDQMRAEFAADPTAAGRYVTWIADGFPLLPAAPKVTGRMWADVAANGALRVRTNYVFAYAFDVDQPDRLLSALDIVAVRRQDADFELLDGRWTVPERGLWPGDANGYDFSISCAAIAKNQLAPAYSDRPVNADPVQPDQDRRGWFDPARAIPTDTTC